MSEIKLVETNFDGEYVTIKLPLDLLKFACENNPDINLEVGNDEEFGEWIAESIWEFDEDGETGISRMQQLLDDLFIDMYELGGPVYDPNELDGCDFKVEE